MYFVLISGIYLIVLLSWFESGGLRVEGWRLFLTRVFVMLQAALLALLTFSYLDYIELDTRLLFRQLHQVFVFVSVVLFVCNQVLIRFLYKY